MPSISKDSLDFSEQKHWLLLPLFCGLLVFCFSMSNIRTHVFEDPDTFMHLASGSWILSHGYIPTVDPFSFNTQGLHWIDHEWLAQVILAFSFSWGGLPGVRFLVASMFAITLACQLRFLVARMPAIYAVFLTSLTFISLLSHHLARPHILTWPILVCWFIGLVRNVEKESWKAPYWLSLWMVLWANIHGGFILGLLAIPFFGVELYLKASREDKAKVLKSWSKFFLLSLVLSWVTPFGWNGVLFATKLISAQYTSRIIEWTQTSGYDLLPIELWVLVLLAMGLSGYLRLPLARLLLLLGFVHESLSHVRYTSMFGLVTPLLIAQSFGELYYSKRSQVALPKRAMQRIWHSNKPILVSGILFVSTGLVLIWLWATNHQDNNPNPYNTPVAAIDFVQQSKIKGNGLNFYNIGGYLIYRRIPVFIDGRVDLYGDQKMDEYFAITDVLDESRTTDLLAKHEISWTIFPPNEKMVLYLNHRPEWKKVFEDRYSIVHVRVNPQPSKVLN